MRKLLTYVFQGVGSALSLFVLFGIFYDIYNGGIFVLENASFTRMAIGSIVVGLGFSVPALIYEKENIPYATRVLIHMGIGCVIMIITAYVVGWIPKEIGILGWSSIIFTEILTAFLLWLGFSWYYRQEIKMIDKKIKEKNTENEE